jgi:hypothetical protein
MVKYSINTRLSAERVIDKAVIFFGDKLNMDITERRDCCIRFTGGGGFVYIYKLQDHGVEEIIIESQEWDARVKEFLVAL